MYIASPLPDLYIVYLSVNESSFNKNKSIKINNHIDDHICCVLSFRECLV